ncbi:dihydrofolate reductase family protein [Fusibacter bizertensis]
MIQKKVILYIAMSLDGYIAKPDNDISWLSIVEQPNEDYGYQSFVDSVDMVLMGRKTYEKVLTFGVEFPHKDRKCYIISKSRQGEDGNVEFYGGELSDLITSIKEHGDSTKNIFVDGGATLANSLIKQNLIDEFIISIIPILLGDGIKLFQNTLNEQPLKLIKSESFASGLVQLTYIRK